MVERNPTRVTMVSSYPPQNCGVAVFARDLFTALQEVATKTSFDVAALTNGESLEFPPEVQIRIQRDDRSGQRRAAQEIREREPSVISLQVELGILGGPCGVYILELLRDLDIPVVGTVHSDLESNAVGRRVALGEIARRCTRLVVMTEYARARMRDDYLVPESQIDVVPHGVHPRPARDRARRSLSNGRSPSGPRLLTFGLLTPYKGIEHVITAMRSIVRTHPGAVYTIAGPTHSGVVHREGENYRHSLRRHADQLGIGSSIRLDERFFEGDDLRSLVDDADLVITPYTHDLQGVSGTLAYALGAGVPVISTLFPYAREMLAGGAGITVPFADPDAIVDAVIAATSTDRYEALSARAEEARESMQWPVVARQYADSFRKAVA